DIDCLQVDPTTYGLNFQWYREFAEPTGDLLTTDITLDPNGNPILTALSTEIYGTAPDNFAGYTQYTWASSGGAPIHRVLLGSKLQKGAAIIDFLPNDLASNQDGFGLIYGQTSANKCGQFSTQFRPGPDDSYKGKEDEALTVGIGQGVLRNDGNEQNLSKLTAKLVPGSASAGIASVTVNATGAFTVTPVADFNGAATFQYEKKRGPTVLAINTVTIHFKPKNDAPIAVDDESDLTAGVSYDYYAMWNDYDPDGDAIRITSKTNNPNLTISIGPAGGNLIVTPKPGFTGDASFTYTIKDPRGLTSTATILIHVWP
ncbi:MAG TPA: Ig-like domain-containing protein, partial [Roseimicrobium sp.]|nr:Ig-like domain-containing protein [Roseimicrobium sp.]